MTGGNWRLKYSATFEGGSDPREIACAWLGKWWYFALKEMVASIKEAGLEPWFDPDTLHGSIVLTMDKLLPAEFELTPEVIAGVGTTAIAGQRLVYAKRIKEALLKAESEKQFRDNLVSMKQRAVSQESPAPPPPTSPPVASPPPVAVVPAKPTLVPPSEPAYEPDDMMTTRPTSLPADYDISQLG